MFARCIAINSSNKTVFIRQLLAGCYRLVRLQNYRVNIETMNEAATLQFIIQKKTKNKILFCIDSLFHVSSETYTKSGAKTRCKCRSR